MLALALIAAATLTMPLDASAQSGAATARAAFDRGTRRFQAGRYEQALEAFREAYEARPHPAVLFNIASCLDKLGRPVEAVTEYQRYLRLRGDEVEPARRADVEEALARLRRRVAFLAITPPSPDAAVTVDGAEVELGEDPVVVSSGRHTIESRAAGGRTATAEVDVVSGESLEVRLRLPERAADTGGHDRRTDQHAPRPETPGPRDEGSGWSPTLRWVGLAATAAFAGGLVFTGVRALSLNSEYENDPSPELRDEGLTYRMLADLVFLPGTILAAGFTVIAFVLARREPDPDEAGDHAAIVPILGPGGLGVSAAARF
ncbi:MAG: tetratricopeptide repeat protein [Deltaproteobacteria bacterium]|nr:tetratricopeptide repeat protein [Deltaproteobacteria bacterium]